MLKLLFAFVALITMFSSANCSAPDALKEEIMFDAFNNGYKIEITQEDASKIDELFNAALKGSYPMPALGVSLHDKTLEAVEGGIWLRFAFKEQLTINELNFDQLLINVTKDMYGFNIIRGNDGIYDGRNFYIDLRGNLDELYNYVSSLPVSEEKFEAKFEWVEEAEESNLQLEEELKIKEVFVQEECEDCDKCEDCNSDECEKREECKDCAECDENCSEKECEECKESNLDIAKNSEISCEECAETGLDNCPDCSYHLDVEEDLQDKLFAQSIPSVNKDNKDKNNGVINQTAGKKKDKDYEHMIQYSGIQKSLLDAIKF